MSASPLHVSKPFHILPGSGSGGEIAPSAGVAYDDDAARWQAVAHRDRAADGIFFYSVATTGVYCRPSCAARLPRRENVAFHASPAAAERAGFRACKRCRPAEPDRDARLVAAACRHLESTEEAPTLDILAAGAGLSRFHFHRLFKRLTGVTPKSYAAAHRGRRVQAQLDGAGTVTEALYDAGYNASSRFYAEAPDLLGMTPRAYRKGGGDAEIRFAVARCALGLILVAATERGLCAVTLGDDADILIEGLRCRFPKAALNAGDAAFDGFVESVLRAVDDPARGNALPLDIRGTAFQRRVWEALRAIPPGETLSYGALAARLGMPKAARAVGAACAANTLAVVIPCHRILRADGDVSGYRWGAERKRALLLREGAISESGAVSDARVARDRTGDPPLGASGAATGSASLPPR